MIWELAGDYSWDPQKSQYGIGSTLVERIHATLSDSQPYGATKADVAMPTTALDLGVGFSDFALGDSNYPINPQVTFHNRSSIAIPAGSTITFDYATSDTGEMKEQNGWGLKMVASDHAGDNIGGLDGSFHTAEITVPSGGIPAGGSAATKLSWSLPISQISNLRVRIGTETYAALYDLPRGVTLAAPGSGTPGGGGGGAACTAPSWSATAVYTQGAKVSHDGREWSAKWWTSGDVPGADPWGPWGTGANC